MKKVKHIVTEITVAYKPRKNYSNKALFNSSADDGKMTLHYPGN